MKRLLCPMCGTLYPGHREDCIDLLAMRYAAYERVAELEAPPDREWDVSYWFASDGDS